MVVTGREGGEGEGVKTNIFTHGKFLSNIIKWGILGSGIKKIFLKHKVDNLLLLWVFFVISGPVQAGRVPWNCFPVHPYSHFFPQDCHIFSDVYHDVEGP